MDGKNVFLLQPEDEAVGRPTRQDTIIVDGDSYGGSGKIRREKSYHRGSASVKPSNIPEDETVQ